MKRRNSNRPLRLGHRKSVSSVKSINLEHISPEVAERDAQAAATWAFTMAKERSSMEESSSWAARSISEGTRATQPLHHAVQDGENNMLRRSWSVRFVRPSPKRPAPRHTISDADTPTRLPGITRLRVTGDGIESQPENSASAAGMVSAAKGTAGGYIDALITGEEYYTPEDDVASAPSSYRRMRRSKSMIARSEIGSSRLHTGKIKTAPITRSTHSGGRTAFHTKENIPPMTLKTVKSTSSLKSRRSQTAQDYPTQENIPTLIYHDESIGTSNRKGHLLVSQPSTLFRSKRTNPDRPFRKSMRDTSNSTVSTSSRVPNEDSLRNKARKVSQNVKYKLKSIFSLSKTAPEDADVPPQQVESQRSHARDLTDWEGRFGDFPDVASGDEAELSRVTSGVPSLHAVPSYQQLRSRRGSLESLYSEPNSGDDKSRVTSWSNSDTNTLNTMSTQRGDWERQRLSIIKENGTHLPSSSAKRSDMEGLPRHTTSSDDPRPVMVDSGRIYAALMNRYRQTRQPEETQAIHTMRKQRSVDSFVKFGVAPPRGSSLAYKYGGATTPLTIRPVLPESEPDAASAQAKERKPVARASVETGNTRSSSVIDTNTPLCGRYQFGSLSSRPSSESLETKDTNKASSLRVPENSETVASTRGLSTRSSAFFGSSASHVFRTRSPYRRALQDTMKSNAEKQQMGSPDFNPWMQPLSSLAMRRPSSCESDSDKGGQYAESVYSTDSFVNEPNNAYPYITDLPRSSSVHGSATIFVDNPVRQSNQIQHQRRDTSSSNSMELKSALSAIISKLREPPQCIDSSDLGSGFHTAQNSGHIRESAQITDEEEYNRNISPTQSLGPVSHRSTSNLTVPPVDALHAAHPHGIKSLSDLAMNGVPSPVSPRSSLRRPSPSIPTAKSSQSGYQSLTEMEKDANLNSVDETPSTGQTSLSLVAGNSSRGGTAHTAKLVRRQPLHKNSAASLQAPLAPTSIEKQFEKMSSTPASSRRHGGATATKTENLSPRGCQDEDPYGIQGSGILGPCYNSNSQHMGSNGMVNLFLNSRRRRLSSNKDDAAFI
ncbi:hypothetical protein F5Y15DRAFT_412374 [Xylariaceae sp. FL0016]|nr:hypothetical protein F5Y15DRAFT_412374 [Xylariaceae sp. FL0016]